MDDDNIMPIPEPLLLRALDRRIAMERKNMLVSVLAVLLFVVTFSVNLWFAWSDWQEGRYLGAGWDSLICFLSARFMYQGAVKWEYHLGSVDATRNTKEAYLASEDEEAKWAWKVALTKSMIDLAAAAANYDMEMERERANKDRT